MSRNSEIRDSIYARIESIVARTERITAKEGRMPKIELDLVKDDVKRLYDLFYLLEDLAIQQVGSAKNEAVETKSGKVEEKLPTEKKEPELTDQKPEKDIKKEEEKQEKSKSLANTGTEPPAKPSLESGVQVPPAHKPDQKNSILADKFKEKAVSLNDLIQAHKADKSIGSQMQNNPISNLKTAIGINEKFIFVYELFSGDTNLYHEAIEALNSRASHADAIQYLEELHQKFHWDIENAAFHKLIDLVNRRYA